MNKKSWKERWLIYISREIAIEYKACLYFYCILVFECIYLACKGQFQVSILHMCQMIVSTYMTGYLQIYVLNNFDEAETFGKWELACSILCSSIYTVLSYLFNWFGKEWLATILFFAFCVFWYWCIFLINKIKRDIDTRNLNEMLIQFKEGEKAYEAD